MPIRYTAEQERIKREGPDDNFPDGDHSQTTVQVLGLVTSEKTGEKVYTALLRDPLNFKKPIALEIYVFPDGSVQAVERNLEDVCFDYNVEDVTLEE